MKIAFISCIFSIIFAVFTEYERLVFEQSRTLLFWSGIFLFCLTKIFRLSNSCPATSQKISRRLRFESSATLPTWTSALSRSRTLRQDSKEWPACSVVLMIGYNRKSFIYMQPIIIVQNFCN